MIYLDKFIIGHYLSSITNKGSQQNINSKKIKIKLLMLSPGPHIIYIYILYISFKV